MKRAYVSAAQPVPQPGPSQEAARAAGSALVAFGIHRGRTFADVFEHEPDYCAWAIAQPKPRGAMALFVEYLKQQDKLSDALKRRRSMPARPLVGAKNLRPAVALLPGQQCKIVNLQSESGKAFNGRVGNVNRYIENSRYEVVVDGVAMSFKAENLQTLDD